MTFSKYNKDRPFLVITQHITPAKGENTSVKNWGKTGKKNLQEMVMIVDNVKDKHLTEATVIIDVLQRKVVKSRFDEDNEEVLSHYLKQYKSQIAEGIQIWMGGQYHDEESAEQFKLDLSEEIDKMEELNNIKLDVITDELKDDSK